MNMAPKGHSWPQRHRRLVVVLAGIVLATPTIWFGFGCKGQEEEAIDQITWWHGRAGNRSAEQAAAEWKMLRARIGKVYERLPLEKRILPYYTLERKYFAEGKYEKAFEMVEIDLSMSPREPHWMTIYEAGLAGREEWLRRQIEGDQYIPHEEMDRFIRANLAWISKDYDGIVSLTGFEPSSEADRESADDTVSRAWLHFLRARAFAKKGEFGSAYDILWLEVIRKLKRMEGGTDFEIHCIIIMAECAEKSGNLKDALDLAEGVIKLISKYIDKSSSGQKAAMHRMIGRLEWRLSQGENPTPPTKTNRPDKGPAR